jgi:hypothetical protein
MSVGIARTAHSDAFLFPTFAKQLSSPMVDLGLSGAGFIKAYDEFSYLATHALISRRLTVLGDQC